MSGTRPLDGKVAIITGSSSGIGAETARLFASEGCKVVVNSVRSVAAGEALVAELPDAIYVQGDISDEAQAIRLVDAAMERWGRLDILVNNAFALPEDLTEPGAFWEKPLSNWQMVDVGVRSNFIAAWHAAKIMTPQKSGLIVAISGYVGVTYTYGVVFGTCKSAVDRMARDMAIELQPYNIASMSLWQGLTFTERAHRNIARNPEMKKLTVTNPLVGCSPEFPGRVIAALAADPEVMKRSGGTFITAEVAADYGIVDIDGKVIPSLRAERGSPIWRPIAESGHGN